MNRETTDGFHYDDTYRMRYVKGLFSQVEGDARCVLDLAEKAEKEPLSQPEIEELNKRLCWAKRGIEEIKSFRNEGIEGNLRGIVRDIEDRIGIINLDK